MLASLRGGDGHLGVNVVAGRDINEADVLTLDELSVVEFVLLPAELPLSLAHALFVAAAYGLHNGAELHIREVERHIPEGLAVGLAHEFVADKADVDLLWHCCGSSC